jgi:hypothetical protein
MGSAVHVSASDPTIASASGQEYVSERSPGDRRFERITLLVFAVYASVLSALHEPWKDETQTWRLAIDTHGIRELAWNARYEGHPLLFHLMLQALGHLSRSWWAAVALHVVIACAAVWVVLRHAPFTRLEKALVVAGYFPAYEYAVIVRPYGLGMLLAFAACATWTSSRRKPLLTIVLLVLLANSTVLGLLLALAAGVAFYLDWIWSDDGPPRIGARELLVGASCAVLALAVAWLVARQVMPPADAAFKGDGVAVGSDAGGFSAFRIGEGLLVPFRAMVPLDKIGEGTAHWSRWLFAPRYRPGLVAGILVSTGIGLAGCVLAVRRRTSLVFYLLGTLGFVAFFVLFVEGAARHHGYLAIVWIMAVWLSRSGPPTVWTSPISGIADRARTYAPRLFALSLVPMVLATVELAVSDAVLPFSDARRTADFLRASGLSDGALIGIARADAQAVAALLDRPVLLPSEGRTSTFVLWGAARKGTLSQAHIDAVVDSVLQRECRVVLISTQLVDSAVAVTAGAKLIYATGYRPVSKDRYDVWLRTAPPSARCPVASTAVPAR